MGERPLVDDYFQEFSQSAPQLIKHNIKIAKAEVAPMAKHLGLGVGSAGGVGFFLLKAVSMFGFAVAFLFAMIYHHVCQFSVITALFLAFLTCGVLFLIGALIAGLFCRSRFKKVHAPKAAIEEAKQTAATLSAAIARGRQNAKTIVEANRYAREEAKKAKQASRNANPIVRFFTGKSAGKQAETQTVDLTDTYSAADDILTDQPKRAQ